MLHSVETITWKESSRIQNKMGAYIVWKWDLLYLDIIKEEEYIMMKHLSQQQKWWQCVPFWKWLQLKSVTFTSKILKIMAQI